MNKGTKAFILTDGGWVSTNEIIDGHVTKLIFNGHELDVNFDISGHVSITASNDTEELTSFYVCIDE